MTAKFGSSRNRFAVAVASLVVTFASANSFAASGVTTQLPRTVRPVHYDVAIDPDPATLTYSGQVAIEIEVLQPTDRITLNAVDLKFRKVGLSGATRLRPRAHGAARE